jgi:hypothetical protein
MMRTITMMAAGLVMLTGCDAPPQKGKHDAAVQARIKGVRDAQAAVSKGTLLLKEYPPLPASAQHGEYVKLLKEKCNCAYEVVSAPSPATVEMREEVEGWNDTMRAELRRQFGDSIIDDLKTEANKRWEARTKAKEEK